MWAVQVQHVQQQLLRMIQSEHPHLMYPAALGCLADLEEVRLMTRKIQCAYR